MAHPSTSSRLLLAEDDPELRETLAALLRLEGYSVRTMPDGVELLDFLAAWILRRTTPPSPDAAPADALITDIRMPGFNGLQIVAGLRAKGWRLPIIVITAFGSPEVRERIRSLGDTEVFDKPIDTVALLRRLDGLLH